MISRFNVHSQDTHTNSSRLLMMNPLRMSSMK